ncbi:EAL domain-containing protein [Christensenellaceae bacterium OttesenSCG-928-M15]|nr:EAL domain-containing protein [Christensenellaceae bacterium OttesenSCG-928-M15]
MMEKTIKYEKEYCVELHKTALHSLPEYKHLMEYIQSLEELNNTYFVCYDIESLRKINFSYGHPIGDILLWEVADWVMRISGGALYRIEGDMFCIVLENKKLEQVLQFAYTALKRSHSPWVVHDGKKQYDLFVTASLAVVPASEDVIQQNLIDLFDRTLNESKKSNNVAIFDLRKDNEAKQYYRFQMDVKTCILKDMQGFFLCYQPIVDPATGLWKGLEALCRWDRPGIGPVSPAQFIPEAERLNLIHVLGRWVLKTAIHTCVKLKLFEIDNFFLSVNVCALQLVREDFGRMVATILAVEGFPPHQLNLEITESYDVSFDDETRRTIDALRRLGVTFALDDFGTGFSSFSHLKNLPAQYVKIERTFVCDIEKNNYLQYSIYVISETAHLNGMSLVCEGIETTEQLQCAVSNGVDFVQGYYYSKPLTVQELQKSISSFTTAGEAVHLMKKASLFSFSQWLESRETYCISPGFFGLLNRCMELVFEEDVFDNAVNKISAAIGEHFSIKRVFVFLRDYDHVYSNRYEWCARGVQEQMHLFQRMDSSQDGFDEVLREQRLVITTSEQQLPEELKRRLKMGNQSSTVQSTIVMPMKRRDEVIGFVGFDDDCVREWKPEEILVLHNLCLLMMVKQDVWDEDAKKEERAKQK